MKKQAALLIVLLLFLVCYSSSVHAVALGVNKAKLSFEDVLRNGYAEDSFIVSTDSPDPIGGVLEINGSIAEWISFEPANANDGFVFSADSPVRIVVKVEPPADAANGEHTGSIRVLTGEIMRTSDGRMGTSTRAAFKLSSIVGITGEERRTCVIGGSRLSNTEVGDPLDLVYSIKNTGNVRIAPEITLKFFDQSEEEVVLERSVQTESEVLPTTSENFLTRVAQDLPIGQYWASISSPDCSGSAYVTFDVLERGGILDSGELVRIDVEPWVSVGDIVPITAVFRNTGSRTVSAKFKGTIMRGRRLIKVIDTDFYDTPSGATANIETFFNPDQPGQYEIKGRVLYNNKLTFERTSILNVTGSGARNSSSVFLIVVVIVFLLFLIIRKKKRKKGFSF